MNPTQVYLHKMVEASKRIAHCQASISSYAKTHNFFDFESSVLQLRKVMECLALAAIAPNRLAYETYRRNAEQPADFRKDFNGKAILRMLEQINPDFYPIPLHPSTSNNRHHHFDRLKSGFLRKSTYGTTYDRLGKFLHADNPWGDDKGVINLAKSIPDIIEKIIRLLTIHATCIRTTDASVIWIVEVNFQSHAAKIIEGQAPGNFKVNP